MVIPDPCYWKSNEYQKLWPITLDVWYSPHLRDLKFFLSYLIWVHNYQWLGFHRLSQGQTWCNSAWPSQQCLILGGENKPVRWEYDVSIYVNQWEASLTFACNQGLQQDNSLVTIATVQSSWDPIEGVARGIMELDLIFIAQKSSQLGQIIDPVDGDSWAKWRIVNWINTPSPAKAGLDIRKILC